MQFLASDTGVKLLELIQLESPAPKSMNNSTIESFALQSARHLGWSDVSHFIESLLMINPDKVGQVEWHQEEQSDPRKLSPNPL